MTGKKRPIKKLKIGRVNAAVFENHSKRGTWYTVSIDRVNKHGDEFRRVSTFPENELENLAAGVAQTKQYIEEQRK